MAAKWQQWMPLYVDRFMGSMDVQMMEPPAFKAYVRLLLYAWQTEDCTTPSDPDELTAWSGLPKKVWLKHSAVVLRKFVPVSVAVGDTVTVRLRNVVEFELWTEAKRIHEARKKAAAETNKTRSPQRSPSEIDERSPSRSAIHNNNPLQEQEQKQETRGTPPSAPPDLAPVNPDPKPEPTPEALEALPFDAEPEDNIPDGLASMQYAHFVLTEAAIPAGYALKVKTGDAIEMLARIEACGMAQATRRMLDRMKSAQQRGDKVNGFWFEDGNWKPGSGRASPGNAAAARDAFLAEGGD